MNEQHRGTARRVRRLQPDDPRFAACTLWLRTSTLTPETQDKIRAAIFKALDESDEYTTVEEVPDEVRQPGLAEEVQGRPVPQEGVTIVGARTGLLTSPALWELWVNHYGVEGARRLALEAGLGPRE